MISMILSYSDAFGLPSGEKPRDSVASMQEDHNRGTTHVRGIQGRAGTILLGEPLLAFLHVLVEQEGHVADNKREDDLREEF